MGEFRLPMPLWNLSHGADIHNTYEQQPVARKITGDPCVPAGDITFEGSFSEDTNSLLMTVGLPPEPSSGKIPVQISVIDHNSFHINGLLFVRQVGVNVNLDIIGSNGEQTPTNYHHWGASRGSHIAGPTVG